MLAAVNAPGDEMAALRDALRAGAWASLGDPRLTLALLDDPSAWGDVVQACGVQLAVAALGPISGYAPWAVLRAWGVSLLGPGPNQDWLDRWLARRTAIATVAHTVLARLPATKRPRAALHLARYAVTFAPRPDLEQALAVLERWPVDGA